MRLSGEGFVGFQKRWALIGTGVPGRGREHGTLSFSLKAVNGGGEGMETELVLPTDAQPQGMSQRRRPPCSPGQWVYSPCDLSKCQVLPGVQDLPRALLAGGPHKEQGPAGTRLTVQTVCLEGAAPPLPTGWVMELGSQQGTGCKVAGSDAKDKK